MTNWSEDHRPRSLEEVVGNNKSVKKMRRWARDWSPGDEPLLLHGPAGTGKTSAALALAEENGFDVVEMNASDVRTADAVKRVGGSAAVTGTLTGGTSGRRLVLIDEVDNLHGNSDRGGARAMTDLVKQAEQPVVMICNDVYEVPKGVRNRSEEIKFDRLRKGQVSGALKRICERENLTCEREALEAIAGRSDGDLRSAVNDLQALTSDGTLRVEDVKSTGYRDRESSVFEALDDVLKGGDLEEARSALFDLDETPEDLVHWVDENMEKVFSPEELADAYDFLTRADVFLGRTRSTGNYTFWGYASEMTAAVGQASRSRRGGWTRYGFPSHWSRMGRTKSARKTRESLETKVARGCHASRREAREDLLPFIRLVAENDRESGRRVVGELDLEESEVELLAGDSAEELMVEREEPGGAPEPKEPDGSRDDGSDDGQSALTEF